VNGTADSKAISNYQVHQDKKYQAKLGSHKDLEQIVRLRARDDTSHRTAKNVRGKPGEIRPNTRNLGRQEHLGIHGREHGTDGWIKYLAWDPSG